MIFRRHSLLAFRDVSSDRQRNAGSLSRAERMVKAAHSNRRSLSTSPCSTTSSTTPPREDNGVKSPPGKLLFGHHTDRVEKWMLLIILILCLSLRVKLGGFRTSSDKLKAPQEQRKKSKARYELIKKKKSYLKDRQIEVCRVLFWFWPQKAHLTFFKSLKLLSVYVFDIII